MNLLIYHIHPPTNKSLDSLSCHSFLSYIPESSRVTANCRTLIDNILSNIALTNIISGNLTPSISDYFPHFFAAPNIFCNDSCLKSNNYERVIKI